MVLMPVLAIAAAWTIGALITAKLDRHHMGATSRTVGHITLAGFGSFATCLALASSLPSALPTGSYDNPFNRTLWLDASFATDPPGQATPRQKMLGAAIAHVLPSAEIPTLPPNESLPCELEVLIYACCVHVVPTRTKT